MGYTDFHGKNFSPSLFRLARESPELETRFWHAEARDCSWRKLIPASDFLQGIVALTVPFRPPITRFATP
jgi:hypothetical protein